ncbi:hypothetical protein R1flu_011923 [Riccia fluitans]|uniref:SMP domain-containing protein n=1 Tax=Riccia fluitans TaxID=41844 RepID=A0ABD1Z955_9MARC
MADVDVRSSDVSIHRAVDVSEAKRPPPQLEDSRPQQSCESANESAFSLGLSGDSWNQERRDEQCHLSEEQLEKLKEFLSEAAYRGDDVVTQSDADTVRALENMQNLQLGNKSETGLGARLESAARANLEIQNQAASGYYPSETVYLEEHTLKEVLEESGAVISLEMPSPEVSSYSPKAGVPRAEFGCPDIDPSPTKNIDAESALKNELDCLFQERAQRFRGSP